MKTIVRRKCLELVLGENTRDELEIKEKEINRQQKKVIKKGDWN